MRNGLVDNRSASIDESWQALRFVYRLEDRRDLAARRASPPAETG